MKEESEEMEEIFKLWEKAKEHNLETEIIYYALKEMKENNSITPVMAMMSACREFDI